MRYYIEEKLEYKYSTESIRQYILKIKDYTREQLLNDIILQKQRLDPDNENYFDKNWINAYLNEFKSEDNIDLITRVIEEKYYIFHDEDEHQFNKQVVENLINDKLIYSRFFNKTYNFKMILGTHNSITGETSSNLLGKLLNWTTKCQDLSIKEQFDKGVRAFDLRIKRKKGNWVLCHGLAEYNNSNIFQVLNDIETLAKSTNEYCYVRLGLESLIGMPSDNDIVKYSDFKLWCINTFNNIVFCGYIKHAPRNSTIFSKYSINIKYEYVELQHSPSNIWEALKGPRRLLKYQLDDVVGDLIAFKDFVE